MFTPGFGHYEGARATYVYKWGVGPYLDGLFTQSNFGMCAGAELIVPT